MKSSKRSPVRIRPGNRTSARVPNRVGVFTALDGTLLDSRTFDAGTNRGLIQRLLSAGIPVIPVSVMTLDEIAPIAANAEAPTFENTIVRM